MLIHPSELRLYRIAQRAFEQGRLAALVVQRMIKTGIVADTPRTWDVVAGAVEEAAIRGSNAIEAGRKRMELSYKRADFHQGRLDRVMARDRRRRDRNASNPNDVANAIGVVISPGAIR